MYPSRRLTGNSSSRAEGYSQPMSSSNSSTSRLYSGTSGSHSSLSSSSNLTPFSSTTSGLSSRYSSRIIGSGGIFVSTRSRFSVNVGNWINLPEDILLCVFPQLVVCDVLSASRVCKHWHSVAISDYLWKKYFMQYFQQDSSIPLPPSAPEGWRGEFSRLWCDAPVMLCEVLRHHKSFVLHVAFSNEGDLFTTCSSDATVMVWCSDHPCSVVYQADLHRRYHWQMASYSQFNSSDTMLMVSGAFFSAGSCLTAGEVAVFDLENNFRLLSRTKNRPYDLFGAWITDDYLVTGELKWLQNRHSTSTLLLIRSTQECGSEHVPILRTLLRLFNSNAACARCLVVAHCSKHRIALPDRRVVHATRACADEGTDARIVYSENYYDALQSEWESTQDGDGEEREEDEGGGQDQPSAPRSLDDGEERLLIYTSGDHTFTPHQIGIIRLRPEMPDRVEVEHNIAELLRRRYNLQQRVQHQPGVDTADYDSVRRLCRAADHTIEMRANVVGLALSPDHRFLYVVSHPWLGPVISPVTAPAVARHSQLHVFDLTTLQQVGALYCPLQDGMSSDESYYVFPSVSRHYVASGGSTCGTLWDRHFGLRLAALPHSSAVSAAAVNPRQPDMAVTVSDDKTIKVWRSRRVVRALRIVRAVPAEDLLLPSLSCRPRVPSKPSPSHARSRSPLL